MKDEALRLAVVGGAESFGADLRSRLDALDPHRWKTVERDGGGCSDVVLAPVRPPLGEAPAAALADAGGDAALLAVVAGPGPSPEQVAELLAAGADEVAGEDELAAEGLERALRRAVARRAHLRRRIAAGERRLRDAEERFARAFTASPLVLTVTSLMTGRLVDVNETFCRVTGWSREEAVGRTTLELGLWADPGERAMELSAVVARGGVRNLEFRFRRRDGSELWGLLSAELCELGGEPCALSTIADVSELKWAEEALRDADRAKDRFLAVLAHELRNPLAPIRQVAGILTAQAGGDSRLAWCAEVLERQTAHMARLLEDLLDVSRIKEGRVGLRRQPVLLAAVLEQAVETSGPLIDAAGHELRWRPPERSLVVEAEASRLAQVFANLLNNAARYSDPGAIIELAARRRGEEVEVVVRDTGIGIEPERLPRLFEMFSGGERAATDGRGGLGVGLAVARGLVELHGGRIEARSPGRGAGSEFVVRLPLAAGTAAPEPLHEPR